MEAPNKNVLGQEPTANTEITEQNEEAAQIEQTLRKIAVMIYHRRGLQQQSEELQSNWETRCDGFALLFDIGVLNHQIKDELDAVRDRMNKWNTETDQQRYNDLRAGYQHLITIQRQAGSAGDCECLQYQELD